MKRRKREMVMNNAQEYSQTKPRNDLSAEEVRELFDYDDETGVLYWAIDRSIKTKAGDVAGGGHNQGYLRVGVNYSHYLIHRIVWLLKYGDWPKYTIDHIDGDKKNNRISNLRDCPQQENLKNQGLRTNSSSGIVGVNWIKATSKWRAIITIDGRTKVLGQFINIKDAEECRLKANAVYGFHENHGSRKCNPNMLVPQTEKASG
jgi:hypothetical protein